MLIAIDAIDKKMTAAVEVQKGGKGKITEDIVLPDGITASVSGRIIALKGPKGETSRKISAANLTVTVSGNKVLIESGSDGKKEKTLVGSMRAHLVNMVKGVRDGHAYRMKVCFTHFPITVTVAGNQLLVKNFLGEKTPRKIELPANVKVKVEGADITIESSDKEIAGKTAAAIEQITKRANYDKRVFGDGIYITVKDSKEIK